ncbi:GLE1-domain-containing protein [Lophium mytilinum]|uniref:mRNA export factor GLE1 n=1 Tax=Lophium mytilinum TaxID=390894 RepID=A0A6A6QUL5_9PEZI|nr:GLE1-domain-containing protein [Lophium mytilinum]
MPATPAHSSGSMESAYSPPSRSSSQSPIRYAYDSPTRQIYAETDRRRRRSNQRALEMIDSPSRQLMVEFGQMMLHSEAIHNLRLDQATADYVKPQQEILAAAATQHARLLRYAEGELRIELMELERQRIEAEIMQARRDEAKRIELLRIERQKEDEAREEQKRAAAEQREKELREQQLKAEQEKEARRVAELEAEQQRQAAQAEADRQAKAAADAEAAEKARQAALQAQQSQQASQAPTATAPVAIAQHPQLSPSTLTATLLERKTAELAAREAEHKRYLDLHKALKIFRNDVEAHNKDHAQDPNALGTIRRRVTAEAGKVSANKAANAKAAAAVREILREGVSAKFSYMSTVDVRKYIVRPIPAISQDSEAQYPTMLLYLLNILAKRIVNQFVSEGIKDYNPIDPLGLMAVSIFSDDEFKWKGVSLFDLVLAKLHAQCAVLFGIYGKENTEQGRKRLGWRREGGEYDDPTTYMDRVRALGAGFASMTLRQFNKKIPPIPAIEFWRALECIINVPSEEVTATHYYVLQGMLKGFVEKLIIQFGPEALVAVKMAVIDFPKRVTEKTPNADSVRTAARTVEVLADVWKRDLGLTLA